MGFRNTRGGTRRPCPARTDALAPGCARLLTGGPVTPTVVDGGVELDLGAGRPPGAPAGPAVVEVPLRGR